MKKTLAIMLALIMVLAMVPALAEPEPTETINIPVTKEWDDKDNEGDKPTEVTVKLLANNQDTNKIITLNATNSWKGVFNGMPVSDGNGIITYTVEEKPIPNYEPVYTQPQPEQVTVGEWGEKITPASNPTYTVTKNIIVANKGSHYYVWTNDNLRDAQKPKLLAAINAANLDGFGAELAVDNTVFQSNIPATFTTKHGNVTISKNNEGVVQINFGETSAWSLFYEGTLTIKEATGAIITNTYTSAPNPDPDPGSDTGSLTISKTVENLPNDKLPDSFTFEIKKGDTTREVTVNKKADGTYTQGNVENLPVGEYTVVEKDAKVQGYILSTTSNLDNGTVTVTKEGTATITFTNIYKSTQPPLDTGTLIVTKTVESNDLADKDKEFNFKVTVITAPNPSEPPIAMSANAVKAPAVRSANKTAIKDDFKDENGIPTLYFNLKDGDMMTISNLPVEKCTYHVEELDADGYTVTVNNKTTTSKDVELTKENPTETLNFKNTKGSTPTPTPTPYNGGGGYYHPTTTPVPVIVIPPKTGDMTVWQSILHFLGIR